MRGSRALPTVGYSAFPKLERSCLPARTGVSSKESRPGISIRIFSCAVLSSCRTLSTGATDLSHSTSEDLCLRVLSLSSRRILAHQDELLKRFGLPWGLEPETTR